VARRKSRLPDRCQQSVHFCESIAVRRNIATVPPSTHSTARKISRNFFGHFANIDRAAEKLAARRNFSVGRLVADRKVGCPPSRPPTFGSTSKSTTEKLAARLVVHQLFGRPSDRRPKSWLPAKSTTDFWVDLQVVRRKVGCPPSRPPTFRWTTWRPTEKFRRAANFSAARSVSAK